jgi:hypothetical protein
MIVSLPPCASASAWRAEIVATPGPVTVIEAAGTAVVVAIGPIWYRLAGEPPRLEAASAPQHAAPPVGALPDARVVVGHGRTVRAWLAEPTRRYNHGVLGDAIEASSLVIAHRDGGSRVLRLGQDSVFEDIAPRIVTIDGAERIVLVKSYLDRGAALAVIDPDTATIIAETPPIGRPNAWLDPAGVADFDGDGATDIALVRQPHVLGRLELWSWRDGGLHKTAEVAGVSNHVIGSRNLAMSAVADVDGDGRPDLAIPSLDRRALRLIAFAPQPHDIARVPLPARVVTDIGAIMVRGRPVFVAGLEDGRLVVVRGPR